MATTYKTRIIYKEHSANSNDFTGSYDMMLKAKSMPSPKGAPNMVETTTYEDNVKTFEEGVQDNAMKDVVGNLSKDELTALDALAGKDLDIIQLYGTDGVGGVAKYAYVGTVAASPNDVSGIDGVLEMTAHIVPKTVPTNVTSTLTVTYNSETNKYTVAAATP